MARTPRISAPRTAEHLQLTQACHLGGQVTESNGPLRQKQARRAADMRASLGMSGCRQCYAEHALCEAGDAVTFDHRIVLLCVR